MEERERERERAGGSGGGGGLGGRREAVTRCGGSGGVGWAVRWKRERERERERREREREREERGRPKISLSMGERKPRKIGGKKGLWGKLEFPPFNLVAQDSFGATGLPRSPLKIG